MYDSSGFKNTSHLTVFPKVESKTEEDLVVCRKCKKKVSKYTESKYAYYGINDVNRYFYCLDCAKEYKGHKTLRVLEYDYFISG